MCSDTLPQAHTDYAAAAVEEPHHTSQHSPTPSRSHHQSAVESSLDTGQVLERVAQQGYRPLGLVQALEKHLQKLQAWAVQEMIEQKQHSVLWVGNVSPPPSSPTIAPRDSSNRDVQNVEIRWLTVPEHV